jgi:hypothetical protein
MEWTFKKHSLGREQLLSEEDRRFLSIHEQLQDIPCYTIGIVRVMMNLVDVRIVHLIESSFERPLV